jgi:soluble lytic murein transglycosylase-like protein
MTFVVLPGCKGSDAVSALAARFAGPPPAPAKLDALENSVLSWRVPSAAQSLRGLRLLYDLRPPLRPSLAVVHSIVRSNPRLDPFDALVMATYAVSAAGDHRLDYGFFCATLLQESGFAPDAASGAGAFGIAQFTPGTADGEGVDPFDWRDAIRGSAELLGGYVAAYDGTYGDPYAAALAAYNAGPGSVSYYHGVPPYAETREYVADVYDRWARIVRNATGPRVARR